MLLPRNLRHFQSDHLNQVQDWSFLDHPDEKSGCKSVQGVWLNSTCLQWASPILVSQVKAVNGLIGAPIFELLFSDSFFFCIEDYSWFVTAIYSFMLRERERERNVYLNLHFLNLHYLHLFGSLFSLFLCFVVCISCWKQGRFFLSLRRDSWHKPMPGWSEDLETYSSAFRLPL